MREAIGGTWLTGIVITFIVIFSGFLAYSISYTKAFRAKNEIISIIEQNEGYTVSKTVDFTNPDPVRLAADTSTEAKIYRFIKSVGYNYSMSIDCDTSRNVYSSTGYCITKHCSNDTKKIYYSITTYVQLTIPIANVGIKIPVTGQTKTMYYNTTDNSVKCYE
jgi:hypothetical protein